ncbi:MAG: DUF86 domain-containing protein [Candidatus Neomarinimicrobiota bacterium]
MPNKIADTVRLRHILDAIEYIELFLKDVGFAQIEADKMLQSACLHQLQVIGESANHFSEDFFKKHQSVEWGEIVGLRNLLIHEYFGVDIKLVWQVLQTDIPRLKSKILDILKEIPVQDIN